MVWLGNWKESIFADVIIEKEEQNNLVREKKRREIMKEYKELWQFSRVNREL